MPITGKSIRIDPIKKSVFGDNSLDPAWEADKSAIDDVLMGYSQGAYSADQLEEIMSNNPHTGTYMRPRMALIDKRKEIFGRHFVNQPQQGPVAPNMPPLQDVPVRQDFLAAQNAMLAGGDVKGARELLDYELAPLKGRTGGGSITTTLLGVRATGQSTGNPSVDSMSPKEAQKALENLQPFVDVVDPTTGEITTVPRIRSGGANRNTRLLAQVGDLEDRLQKSRLLAIAPAVRELAPVLKQAEVTGELPGIGRLKNISAARFALTAQGLFIQSAATSIFNEELRQASGVAVTAWEEQRKRIQDALTAANSGKDYVIVFNKLILPRLRGSMASLRARNRQAYEILKSNMAVQGIDLDNLLGEKDQERKPTGSSSDDEYEMLKKKHLGGK